LQHDLQRRELRLRQVAAPRDERTQRERADDQQPDGGEEPQRRTRGLRHAPDPTGRRRSRRARRGRDNPESSTPAACSTSETEGNPSSSTPSACSTQSCLLIFGGSAGFAAPAFASAFASAFFSSAFFSAAFLSSPFLSPAFLSVSAFALPASSATSAG